MPDAARPSQHGRKVKVRGVARDLLRYTRFYADWDSAEVKKATAEGGRVPRGLQNIDVPFPSVDTSVHAEAFSVWTNITIPWRLYVLNEAAPALLTKYKATNRFHSSSSDRAIAGDYAITSKSPTTKAVAAFAGLASWKYSFTTRH